MKNPEVYDTWQNPKDKEIYEKRKKGIKTVINKPHKSLKNRYNRIKVKCFYCKKVLYRIPARLKLYKRQFCDRECHAFGKHLYMKSVHKNFRKSEFLYGKKNLQG